MILAASIAGGSIADLIGLVGASGLFKVYAGSVPSTCEDAPGAMLARVVLPSTWLTSGGAKVGEWVETSVDATGDATYFRLYDSTETTCGAQGLVGSELEIDMRRFEAGADFSVTRFQLYASGGSLVCKARAQSLFRSLVRSMVREVGAVTPALVKYQRLLRDLKRLESIPVSYAGNLLCEDGSRLTTEAHVPFQLEGTT